MIHGPKVSKGSKEYFRGLYFFSFLGYSDQEMDVFLTPLVQTTQYGNLLVSKQHTS